MILKTNCETEFEIDDEDYHLFVDMYFSLTPGIRGGYVMTHRGSERKLLHKMLLIDDSEVDHKDTNKLNNKKDNLRYTTRAINLQNRHGYGMYAKGVTYDDRRGRYSAKIQIDKVSMRLGAFDTEQEASDAYNKAALEYYGPDAMLSAP
jgi:hypothetical protein